MTVGRTITNFSKILGLDPKDPMSIQAYSKPHLLEGTQSISGSPYLVMNAQVLRELAFYFFLKDSEEMQVMGFVERSESNEFRVTDLVIPPQTQGSSHASLEEDKFSNWLDSL